jgi:hypothetical protein
MQTSAQFLQQSMSCFLHSMAQSSQHFKHNAQSASANFEPRAHNFAHRLHISAQSRHNLIHSSCPFMVKHATAHFSHSTIQAKQTSIHTLTFFIVIIFISRLISAPNITMYLCLTCYRIVQFCYIIYCIEYFSF